MDKVRFGLRNTKYAIYDPLTKKYGQLKPMPGSVSLNLTREGGDSSDFYADDGIYHAFAGTNGGYTMELVLARISDEIRQDLLGEIVDDATGLQFETTTAQAAQFALVTEMQGDQNPIGFTFYNCTASRPELAANTQGESPEVDTDTLNIRVTAQEFEYDGTTYSFVQGHIEKTQENADKFAAMFEAVAIPGGEGGQSGLSA